MPEDVRSDMNRGEENRVFIITQRSMEGGGGGLHGTMSCIFTKAPVTPHNDFQLGSWHGGWPNSILFWGSPLRGREKNRLLHAHMHKHVHAHTHT